VVFLPTMPSPVRHTSLADPFRALRHRSLLTMGLTALFYNFGFFALLAYAPFPLDLGARDIGYIFFGWGVCLAVTSVFVAPWLQRRFGTLPTIAAALTAFAIDLVVMAVFTQSKPVLVTCVVVAGAFLGVNNTLVTEAVMRAAPVDRGTASAAYSFVRFSGGAVAPWPAGRLGEDIGPHAPFWMGAGATLLAVAVLTSGRHVLAHIDVERRTRLDPAGALAVADA
jgi:predicted MFS family arabinose efflux permease